MSVISDLYQGNLRPVEQIGHPKDPVYMDLIEDIQKFKAELLDSLTEKQSQLYNTIKESRATMNSMEEEREFVFGFKLGIQFGAELFKSDNEGC